MKYKVWYSKYVEPDTVTQYDAEVIERYIGGGSYALNEKIRTGMPLSETEWDWVNRLNIALSKMPDYHGQVSRSLYFMEDNALHTFLDGHKAGSAVVYPAFTSFTSGEIYNPDGQVQLILYSEHGKDITAYNPSEAEIVYRCPSKFTVVDVKIDGDTHIVCLREDHTHG